MRARDDAMSAVSLPAKKNDSRRQTTTASSANQSSGLMVLSEVLHKKVPDRAGLNIGRDEAFSDAARQDERQPPAPDLLVLGHQLHQAVDARHAAGHFGKARGQADRGKMRGHA